MRDLLDELAREFRRGGITEAHIVADGEHVDGMCEGDRIVVNPAPSVVDTLLHELLHRRYPRWGEKRVSRTANRLVRHMSAAEVRQWYRRYRRGAKRATRIIDADC